MRSIFVANFNAWSVKNKIPELQAIVLSLNLSLVAITETWLDASVPDSKLFHAHGVFRKDRNCRGGGDLLAISNALQPSAVNLSDLVTEMKIVNAGYAMRTKGFLQDVASVDLSDD